MDTGSCPPCFLEVNQMAVSVALLQDAADLIPPEKFLNFGRKTLFIFNIKCYTVHSADLMYVFGVLW